MGSNLIDVKGGAQITLEERGETTAHRRNACRSTNNLNGINIVEADALSGKGRHKIAHDGFDTNKQTGSQSLKVIACDFTLDILVLHQALDAHRDFASSQAHLLLDLLTLDLQANAGTRVAADVELVFGLRNLFRVILNVGQLKGEP